jgi:signal transduction histidine kinase
MIKAPGNLPLEKERLEELHGLGILDTPPEPEYDDLVNLASEICNTPIAMISLVDQHRQWYKARVGTETLQTGRDESFCGHAIVHEGVFKVPDAYNDERFHDNPLVLEFGYRFYAGASLKTSNGHSLGTICAVDTIPRELSERQVSSLESLSRQIVCLFELRKHRDLVYTLNRNKEEIMSVLSHDLRDPFNVVLNISQILLDNKRAMEPAKTRQLIEAIYSTGKSTYDHLDNLLSWLRISGTEIPTDLQAVELAGLIETITDMLQPVATSKNVKLELSGLDDIKVKTDATMLRSILQNLLSNALKFSPEHTTIHCQWHQQDGEVTIQISDQGSGLNEQLQEQINSTELTGQSSQLGTRGETGKGFGLNIAQGFAKRLGSRIKAENSPEGGSIFSIRLPALSVNS